MRILENAALTPVKRHVARIGRLNVGRFFARYGLYDGDGHAYRDWPILISQKTMFPYQTPWPPLAIDRVIDEPVIYAGLIYGQFGHFITESFPNLLAVAKAKRDHPTARILAHSHGITDTAAWKERYAKHLAYFFDKLGLDLDDLDFVLAPTRARSLLVPDAPFAGKSSYMPWVSGAIDALWPMPRTTRPVYFSRNWGGVSARIVDEPSIEDFFASKGFEIVHLQKHDLADQIAIVRAADFIAGSQGSALHWSLYAPMCRSVLSLGYGSRLQTGICQARGQTYAECQGRRPRGGSYRLRKVNAAQINASLRKLERRGDVVR